MKFILFHIRTYIYFIKNKIIFCCKIFYYESYIISLFLYEFHYWTKNFIFRQIEIKRNSNQERKFNDNRTNYMKKINDRREVPKSQLRIQCSGSNRQIQHGPQCYRNAVRKFTSHDCYFFPSIKFPLVSAHSYALFHGHVIRAPLGESRCHLSQRDIAIQQFKIIKMLKKIVIYLLFIMKEAILQIF